MAKRDRPGRKKRPKGISVTMYDVGFGDCFLVAFSYAGGEARRVLIDCGSSSVKKKHMARVVSEIEKDSGGHVDAVVATHRHKDHISTFGLKGLGERLEALGPDVVIQPWTEHPKAKKNASRAPTVFTEAALTHMRGLDAAQDFARFLTENSSSLLAMAPAGRTLANIASLSIPNKKAVLRLAQMGKRCAYVHAGGPSGLGRLLPGVKVTVLGPPTLEQSQGSTRRQTKWDEDEFWKLQSGLAAMRVPADRMRGRSVLFPQAKTLALEQAPSHVGWVARKLDGAMLQGVRRIVRALDRALNNTSVVLLFEVGSKALLFPGDAQLENWQYALADRSVRKRLRKTSVYKVGHHGSTNATPKSLWELFRRRRQSGRGQLVSLLSTERGHHNRVPRRSLVEALASESVLRSTEAWSGELSQTYAL